MNKFLNKSVLCLVLVIAMSSVSAQTAGQLPDFTPLVIKYAPAVVNISTTFKTSLSAQDRRNMPNIPEDSPFYDFFRRFFDEVPEDSEPYHGRAQTSLGSGFIISKDGHVITNYHVVKDAEEIAVRLVDRREFVAEVVGFDEQSDIALLKIEGEDLPSVILGDSDKLKVGEWVLAIGSPFTFDHSVTAGIVSAKGRALPNENYVPFIQTDVAINPGNSGGPLFNMKGEVIGVNSQIYSRTGGFMGLSFAVPINLVNNVYQQLRDNGEVARGWLGVIIQEVTRELAESLDMEKPQGALINKVIKDSPADHAGFEISDVVVKFNNQDVIFSSDLPPIVGNTEIGKTVPVEVIRRGKKRIINVTIDVLPNDETLARARVGAPELQSTNPLNIVVKELTDSQKKELELDHGVMIDSVGEGPAGEAGLRSGDILLLINNERVKNVDQFDRLISDLPPGKPVAILVQRKGSPIFLALKLDDSKQQ